MKALNVPLTPLVQQLIVNVGEANLNIYLNNELEIALKNRVFGKQYHTIRLTKVTQEKINCLRDKTDLSFNKVILTAINELYLDYSQCE
jgi:hypothetical protein